MNRKNILMVFVFALLVGLGSCENDEFAVDSFSSENGKEGLEVENVVNSIKSFAEENAISSKSFQTELEIKEIKVCNYPIQLLEEINEVKLSATSDIPDTTSINLYTVIFEKNGRRGFSLATGDSRLSQIYAYTENSSLSDTLYNLGLASALAQIPYVVQHDLIEFYTIGRITTPVDEEVNLNIGPLLKTQWGQGYPYNLACPIVTPCNERAPAGCTAIAIAQVVTYLDIPRSRYQGTFNYKAFNYQKVVPANYEAMVAKLIKFIGDKVQMTYGCKGSGAWPKTFRPTLDSWGVYYSYAEDANVDISHLVKNLVKGYPHITSGSQKTGEKGAHTWVWDGVRGKFRHQSDGRGTITYTPIGSILYSCNWGWDGAADGWYSTALMEFPTIKNAAYLDNNTQLYIDGLNTGGRNNNVNDDSLPPF